MVDTGGASEYLVAWNSLLNVVQTVALAWLSYRFGRRRSD